MSHYILSDGYTLRGWKGLPFGLQYPDRYHTEFFDRDAYHIVYALDGRHDIDPGILPQSRRALLDRLLTDGIAIPADDTARLQPVQEYRCYPGMYKNYAQWSITGHCNYSCRHCFMSAPDYHGTDLTSLQCDRILDELLDNGILNIALTGGEPFVSPHFHYILDGIAQRGLTLDTLYSNGRMIDDDLLTDLEQRNLHPEFNISFDGAGWHDWLRGVEGAEQDALRALRLLHERGYVTTSSVCLHRHNIGDLRENVNLLASLGLSHVKFNIIAPTGRWKNETEHFISADEAYQAILDYIPQYIADGMPVSAQFSGIIEFDRETGDITIPFRRFSGRAGAERAYACDTVKNAIYISPQGTVLPCMTFGGTAMESSFDSILERHLSDILSDSHYRDTCLTQVRDCIQHNERCRGCVYRLACGAGCRACACGDTGTDYLAIDPDTCHFFRHGWYDRTLGIIDRYHSQSL